ncbi:TetR/AcrR family transcriptional regulator [Xylophilus sp.]|uniref:TetR/AcrR family transcriptional regulator n=1 Tax=Xylophilus sp. TaxID=2653893 RepID=UPI0013BBF4CD|nr:TetR/AcrR family transcriptional regulator [Xylophilus sp.]KAF1047922.1 MAG: HTH-type transcriptional repressor ComR [Xylophilus sp.]
MAQMGRPRSFDRDAAVQQAMHLFWEHGYASTSLAMLKERIGIGAPSFYAAFGSKEALFGEVVERYAATHGQVHDCLWDDALAPRAAVEQALRASARMQTGRGHPRGCLLVLSAGACAPEHAPVQALLAHRRARTREGFERCVRRAVAAGGLPDGTDAPAFAALFHSFLFGLSVQARDGVPGRVLDAAVTEVMRHWDAHAAAVQPGAS